MQIHSKEKIADEKHHLLDEMIERRRNIEQFKGELRLFLKMYKVGFLNFFQLLGNMSIRIVLRVLPRFITKLTYKYLLRK